jgi:ribosomal-protein-alanine N-acetyltransferase
VTRLWTLAMRPATERDIDTIARMETACFTDPWSRSAFASLLGHRHVLFLVADWYTASPESGELSAPHAELAGYVVAWLAADEAEIANLAVAPARRGQRIGAHLLDAALGELMVRGAAAVYLEVRESNAAARRLYASRGFHEVGRRKKYYRRPPEDALVLRRDLVAAQHAPIVRSG